MKKSNIAAVVPEVSKHVVYCGPNVPEMGMVQFAVYKGGYPANVTSAIAKFPDIEKLMVPVEGLSEFRLQMGKAGTEPHRLFHQIKNDLKGGIKK